MFWVCAKIAFTILAHVEPRSLSRDGQIDNACFVRDRFDCIRCPIFAEGDCTAVCMEGQFLGVELRAIESIGGPEIGSLAVRVEDLRIELTCSMDTTTMETFSVLFRLHRCQKAHATLL